jgi:hypothetical protein
VIGRIAGFLFLVAVVGGPFTVCALYWTYAAVHFLTWMFTGHGWVPTF